jgi:hypothetical protein
MAAATFRFMTSYNDYAGDSEDGDEASKIKLMHIYKLTLTGHNLTRRTGRNVGATDSGGRRRRGICI